MRAIKEESKVAKRDWVDHQACSMLQYINVITNLFIMVNPLEYKGLNIAFHKVLQVFMFQKNLTTKCHNLNPQSNPIPLCWGN